MVKSLKWNPKQSIAVIGGAGFVGRHIVAALVAEGRGKVRSIDIVPLCERTAALALLPEGGRSGVEHVEADITKSDVCSELLEGCSAVFHTAAMLSLSVASNPAAGFSLNVIGSWNVSLAAAKAGIGLILSSSVGVYGRPPEGIVDEKTPFWHCDTPYGTAAYGAGKLLAEYNAFLLSEHYPAFRWIGLRYSSVYGYGQHANGRHTREFLGNFDRVLAGNPPIVSGRPDKLNDYLHVRDAARANLCALDAPVAAWGQSYIVASGRVVTSIELARMVCAFGTGRLEPIVNQSEGEGWRGPRYNCAKAKKLLGFAAEVPLEAGLHEIYEGRKGLSGTPS